VAQPARLLRAARCVILRIKVEHDLLPAQVAQGEVAAFICCKREIRRGRTGCRHAVGVRRLSSHYSPESSTCAAGAGAAAVSSRQSDRPSRIAPVVIAMSATLK